MKGKRGTPNTVDEYLDGLDSDKRAALTRLRRDIHAAAPEAEECISYRMPAFRINGKILLWMGAATNHVAFYPGGIVRDFADELAGYDISKGTIRFSPARPLPAALVRKMVKARMAQPPRRRGGGARHATKRTAPARRETAAARRKRA